MARFARSAVAALLLAALLACPAQAAPAQDEYTLDLPGVAASGVGGAEVDGDAEGDPGGGTIGETEGAQTPLAAAGETLIGPAGVALGAFALMAGGILLLTRGRRSS
jgi:hypothetical protein